MPDNSELAQEIGRRLREARLARGEDLDQVARDRFIPAPYLAALEQGAFEQIPGRPYTATLVRAYGNHLGLDGAALAEPLLLAASLIPFEPEPRGQTGGLQSRAALTIIVCLLLTVAAGVTSSAFPQLRPEMTEAELSIVVLEARDEAEWTGGALLATGAPTTIPSPASVSEADKADPNEGHPLTGKIAPPELSGVSSQSAAVQPVVEAMLVPPAETSNDGTGASPDDPYGPTGLTEPRPEAARIPSDGSSASEGNRIDVARPTAQVQIDPGQIGPSPDASTDLKVGTENNSPTTYYEQGRVRLFGLEGAR
jgi:hypothetical protein